MDRKDLTLDMPVMDMMTAMCEGNFGALTVVIKIMKQEVDFVILLCHLDDMNIRGSQIWIGYKYHCGQDLDRFIGYITSRNEEMIAKINEMNQRQGDQWKATQRKQNPRPRFGAINV